MNCGRFLPLPSPQLWPCGYHTLAASTSRTFDFRVVLTRRSGGFKVTATKGAESRRRPGCAEQRESSAKARSELIKGSACLQRCPR